jgi:hypothetical protein
VTISKRDGNTYAATFSLVQGKVVGTLNRDAVNGDVFIGTSVRGKADAPRAARPRRTAARSGAGLGSPSIPPRASPGYGATAASRTRGMSGPPPGRNSRRGYTRQG